MPRNEKPEDQLIEELLDRWEELREQGEPATPEELCENTPELLPTLKERIAVLESMDAHLGPGGVGESMESIEVEDRHRGDTPSTDPLTFTSLRFHAEGGIGEVYKGTDEKLHREVALKFIKKSYDSSSTTANRFIREAEITGSLEHPGILPVYGMGHDENGRAFYAMRFVEGKTLEEAIAAYHESEEVPKELFWGWEGDESIAFNLLKNLVWPFEESYWRRKRPWADDEDGGIDYSGAEEEAPKFGWETIPDSSRRLEFRKLLGNFISVCETIAYAHSKMVVHRDLKPSNIVLGEYGGVFVLDWGLGRKVSPYYRAPIVGSGPYSKTVDWSQVFIPSRHYPRFRSGREEQRVEGIQSDQTDVTQPGAVIGTLGYMSPEQADGDLERIGPPSDIYSLGATLYCLLTGWPAFKDGSLSQVIEKVKSGDFPKPSEVRPDVPGALEAICLKAMANHATERYGTAEELAADITLWLADEPVTIFKDNLLVKVKRWRRAEVPFTGTLFLLLICAALFFQNYLVVGRGEIYEEAGRTAMNREDYDEAIASYTKAIGEFSASWWEWLPFTANDDSADAYCNRGLAYSYDDDNDQAIKDYSEAIRLDPEGEWAWRLRGIAYGEKGDNAQAIKDYSEAIRLDPESGWAWNGRGYTYYKKGDYDQAIKDFSKAIELKPDDEVMAADCYIMRGNAYKELGNEAKAKADFLKAEELKAKSSTKP